MKEIRFSKGNQLIKGLNQNPQKGYEKELEQMAKMYKLELKNVVLKERNFDIDQIDTKKGIEDEEFRFIYNWFTDNYQEIINNMFLKVEESVNRFNKCKTVPYEIKTQEKIFREMKEIMIKEARKLIQKILNQAEQYKCIYIDRVAMFNRIFYVKMFDYVLDYMDIIIRNYKCLLMDSKFDAESLNIIRDTLRKIQALCFVLAEKDCLIFGSSSDEIFYMSFDPDIEKENYLN